MDERPGSEDVEVTLKEVHVPDHLSHVKDMTLKLRSFLTSRRLSMEDLLGLRLSTSVTPKESCDDCWGMTCSHDFGGWN